MARNDLMRLHRKVMRNASTETRAWCRGYALAQRLGYKEIRDCRIVAMAYSMGWLNGKRSKRGAA